jgi:hypothetical protein
MNMKYLRGTCVAATLWLAMTQSGAAVAQASLPLRTELTERVQTTIVGKIVAQPKTVEVSIDGNVFTVMRVNSSLNDASHAGRNTEAAAIGDIVSKAIAGKPELANIHSIRVQYVTRSPPNADNHVVDTVDFRQAPDGTFDLHTT